MKELAKQYDPSQVEDRIYQFWLDGGYFHTKADPDKKPYTIVMPPPNVTGQLHMGHAVDNTMQDILIRTKRMQGYAALWVPGTDHASIATEAKVVEAMRAEGLTKEMVGRDGFLERAWAWKTKYGNRIVSQLKKLGSSCDWERERFTMDEGCSEAVKEVFVRLYDKGLIYRGNRMVNWCPHCNTSISDAEVEYEEKDGSFWHLLYPVKETGEMLELATTRPETMLGDTAVAINGDDPRYAHLHGCHVVLPLLNKEIPIVCDEHADMTKGTGVVKITPAHDPNDFEVGLRHDLPIVRVFTYDGHMTGAADKAAADAVIAKINAIGEVTLEKETAIKEARAAYDALTTVQKNLVKNDGALTTLEAAEATLKQLKADKEQADAVIGWINGLNDPITLAEEQGVQNIRKRYDSLTDAQKALVTNLNKLEKAEKQLTELKAAIADTESKIDAIGTVELTDACKAKIDAARKAYDALNKEQQAKVSNYETLTDAEAEYQKLADKAAADKAAADAVIAKISAIGKVELTADCKAKIDAAREAYTALSDEQKALVSNLKTLTDAENEYKSLADKAAADKVAANAVIDKINAIGNVTKDSGDAIKDARDAYDKLTDDQKKLVPDEILKKLTDAESTYKDLTAPRPRPSDKTNTKTDGKGVKSQNTGDNSQMTLWLSGVLLSAAALLLLAKKRRQDA